jgi:hypothetical protein
MIPAHAYLFSQIKACVVCNEDPGQDGSQEGLQKKDPSEFPCFLAFNSHRSIHQEQDPNFGSA